MEEPEDNLHIHIDVDMWSTNNPPDVIEDTEPFNDIEAAFDVIIDEDDALDLYDMYLEQAVKRIVEIQQRIDNCWAIGYLECSYGYRDVFSPGKVFYSPEADYNYEYKRKFSDSKYALTSYRATWKKLYKYTKDLEYLEYE